MPSPIKGKKRPWTAGIPRLADSVLTISVRIPAHVLVSVRRRADALQLTQSEGIREALVSWSDCVNTAKPHR